MRRRASLLRALPALPAVLVLGGIAVSLSRLPGLEQPDLGVVGAAVNTDALVLARGGSIFGDPATDYTGTIYTPLFAALVSLGHRITPWNGWPLLLAIAAQLSLVGLVARVAVAPAGGRAGRVAEAAGAVGLGALCWWGVQALGVPLAWEARPDTLAWALGLGGLVLAAWTAPDARRRGLVAAAVLLTAAVWTKQTAVVCAVAATVHLALLAALGAGVARRRAAGFAAGLAAANLLVLGVLNLLTDGWQWRLNVAYPRRHAAVTPVGEALGEGLGGAALVLVVLAVAAAAAVAARASLRAATAQGRVATATLVLLALGWPAVLYFRRKQGGDDNHFIGLLWAAGLLAAACWSLAGRRARTAAGAAVVLTAAVVLSQAGPVTRAADAAGVHVPRLHQTANWVEEPADLRAYADRALLLHPVLTDLDPDAAALYPNEYAFADLLAAGVQPGRLVRALLDRRFDGVVPYPLGGTGHNDVDRYASAFGAREEHVLWKLDEVIAARYAPSPDVPAGVLARRPGPERDAWMRDCFGSFAAGPARWRAGRGGGFWCQPRAGGEIALRRTPAAVSELRSTEPLRGVHGSLRLRLTTGSVTVTDGRAEVLVRRRDPRTVTVTAGSGAPVVLRAGPSVPVTIRVGDAGGRVGLPAPAGAAVLRVLATRDSGAVVDLAGLRAG